MNILGVVLGIILIGFFGVLSYRSIMSIVDSRKKAKAEKKKQQENNATVNSSEDSTDYATKTEPKSK